MDKIVGLKTKINHRFKVIIVLAINVLNKKSLSFFLSVRKSIQIMQFVMPEILKQEVSQLILVCLSCEVIASPMEGEFGRSQNRGLVNCPDIFLSP